MAAGAPAIKPEFYTARRNDSCLSQCHPWWFSWKPLGHTPQTKTRHPQHCHSGTGTLHPWAKSHFCWQRREQVLDIQAQLALFTMTKNLFLQLSDHVRPKAQRSNQSWERCMRLLNRWPEHSLETWGGSSSSMLDGTQGESCHLWPACAILVPFTILMA